MTQHRFYRASDTLIQRLPLLIGCILVVFWLIVLLVDVLNVGGLGEWVVDKHYDDGSAFIVLFLEGHPVEWLQWICLGFGAILLGQASALHREFGNPVRSAFALLISLLFLVMLMEDAGNIRHTVSLNITYHGIPELFPNFYEFAVYALYGCIPAAALYFYGTHVFQWNPIVAFFWIGAGFYAVAAIASASSYIGDWYFVVGEALNTGLFDNRIEYRERPGFWLMDTLFEESLELMGGTAFLSYATREKMYARRHIDEPVAAGEEVT